jgi:hypothetical protein
MIRSISNKVLFLCILINLSISAFLAFLMWYTGRFLEGPLHYIGGILFAPSFFILFLLKGSNYAMHFATERLFLTVSFSFYSIIIALVQIIILKQKTKTKKKRGVA